MPILSIIVPIYNISEHIEKCIESILNQTFDDFECILVDDGSTDDSALLCDELKKQDNRIVVIHKMNGGLSDARNAGLERAKGKYIFFVDGDDAISSNLLFDCFEYMENENSDLLVFNFKSVISIGKEKWKSNYGRKKYDISDERKTFEYFANCFFKNKINWSVWNKIYKAEIINKYKLRFVDNKKIFSEDGLFNTCYMLHINTITTINCGYYYYLQREGSLMQNNSIDIKLSQFVEFSKECYEYISENRYSYLRRRYYILFYKIMNKQYIKGNIVQIAEQIPYINDIGFFKKNTRKMLFHCLFDFKYLDDTFKYFIVLHLCLLLAASDRIWCKKILGFICGYLSKLSCVVK